MENIRNDPVSHWRAIRELQSGFQHHHKLDTITRYKSVTSGEVAKTSEENATFAAEYFKDNVFNRVKESSFDPAIISTLPRYPLIESLANTPTSNEIYKHAMKLKNNKSPGNNELLPEFFKIIMQGEMFLCFKTFTCAHWVDPSIDPP